MKISLKFVFVAASLTIVPMAGSQALLPTEHHAVPVQAAPPTDVFAPSASELQAMGDGLFVRKSRNSVDAPVVSSYHKWMPAPTGNALVFRVRGQNPSNLYQVIAWTLPAQQAGQPDDRHEMAYAGYVYAISVVGGDARIVPWGMVEWVKSIPF